MATFEPPRPVSDPIDALPVAELRALIARAGLDHSDCLEKGDLKARAREAQELLGKACDAGDGATAAAMDAAPPEGSGEGCAKKGKKKKKKKGPSEAAAAAAAPASGAAAGGQQQLLAGASSAAVAALQAPGQGRSRDVAKAAGVEWGSDPIPARMVELQRRHDALVDIAEAAKLTMHDVKDHHDYLAGLTKQIAEEGEAMKRKFRLAAAQAARSTNSKRAAQHEAAAKAIQRRQASFNKEVSMTQTEVDWLKQSPAYSEAMEFLDTHWIKTKSGDYVSKQDLKDDQETTFEDMLAQMKLEESRGVGRGEEDEDEGGLTAEEIAEALGKR